jgi:phosphorylcholine metabolism protein LicD
MKLKQTNAKVIKLLYQLMYDMHRLFEKHGISYWIIGGTALGAVRHRGIIPWDDDLDISVDKRDIPALLSLKNKLEECGYGITKFWLGYKIFYLNRPLMKGQKFSFPNLDIFPTEFYKSVVRFSIKSVRDLWPKHYIDSQDLFPLRKYDFGDFKVWGAYSYKNLFNRGYGKNWNRIAYREYDHATDEEIEKVKVKLTESMRVPAKPTKVKKRKCIKDLP